MPLPDSKTLLKRSLPGTAVEVVYSFIHFWKKSPDLRPEDWIVQRFESVEESDVVIERLSKGAQWARKFAVSELDADRALLSIVALGCRNVRPKQSGLLLLIFLSKSE